ncbi:hypothetical protein HDU90_003545 [Geranomyces variabilis]|nr:hypothetical protein HDU90_003545 [Geranomyces variabilis]
MAGAAMRPTPALGLVTALERRANKNRTAGERRPAPKAAAFRATFTDTPLTDAASPFTDTSADHVVFTEAPIVELPKTSRVPGSRPQAARRTGTVMIDGVLARWADWYPWICPPSQIMGSIVASTVALVVYRAIRKFT